MDWANCCIILLLGTALMFSLGIIVPASAYDIGQGDIAYLNETNDISLALAWPDFAVAYCNNGYSGCNPPDQVIRVTGNMHQYWLDPGVWKVGTYYRWDGGWNRGENSVAFTIRSGTRPVNVFDDNNQSISNNTMKTNISASKSFTEDYRHFIIAKGDDFTLKTRFDSQFNNSKGSMWLFSLQDVLLDIPLNKSNEYDYSHNFTSSDTGKMIVGNYKGYMQFSGQNGLSDVFYNAEKDELDTPYDDDIIPDVSLAVTSPDHVLIKYESLTQPSIYFDDPKVPVTLDIVEPEIILTNVVLDIDDNPPDSMWISGKTTWSEGTIITIKLDPNNYALQKDIAAHTWRVGAVGNLSEIRAFNTTIPINADELTIGTHEIQATIDNNHIQNVATHTFRRSDIYIMPTPTPKRKAVILDQSGHPMRTLTTPIPTFTPTPAVTAPQSPIEPKVITTGGSYVVVEGETISPAKPTVAVTTTTVVTTKPTPIPTTKDPNIHVPLPWWIAVMAIGFAVWRKRC